MKFTLVYFALIMSFIAVKPTPLFAQDENCILLMNKSFKLYEKGQFDEAIYILSSVLQNCPLDKADMLQTNKLLAMSYLAIDNIEQAEKIAAKIMKSNPNYKPDKLRENPNYVILFNKFKPDPNTELGFSFGINNSKVKVAQSHSVVFQNDSAPGKYYSSTNYQFMIHYTNKIYKNFWIETGVKFKSIGYEHDLYSVENLTIYYNEQLTYFDVPIAFKYNFTKTKVLPYLFFGMDFSFLNTAQSKTSRIDPNSGLQQTAIVDRKSYRNNIMYGYLGGLGCSYRLNNFLFFIDLQYLYFLQNTNKAGTRYRDIVNLIQYYYIDDDFNLDNIQCNLGISYILQYRLIKK